MSTTNPDPMAALTRSLVTVQQSVQGAKTNKMNPHLKNRYADLGAVWETCRELLAANGLAVTHTFKESPTGDTLTCVAILLHVEGGRIESQLTMKLAKTDPQAVGSAITYARRYTLAALVGIVVDDDDDGNRSSGTGSQHANAPTPIDGKKREINALLLKLPKENLERKNVAGEARLLEEQKSFTEAEADKLIERLKKAIAAQ